MSELFEMSLFDGPADQEAEREMGAGKAREQGPLTFAAAGFRLRKLEVYNWGTFDGKVWTFSPEEETALLTGDVGSGKSTLVDALITLLVSPRKAAFNRAADATAKERTVTSYIRGYFGQKRSAEGAGQPDCLRDVNNYSVLLAAFKDRASGQYVTLAQFFSFKDSQGSPDRFYVVADKELKIARDFSQFERNIGLLKKRLKSDGQIQVFEDYNRYAQSFRQKMGIQQEQALDLFQQTISMKKVEALTDFVRENMLQLPDTKAEVKGLVEHFHDLNSAHEAIIKAKDQIRRLEPLAQWGQGHRQAEKEELLLAQMHKALGPWFAGQKAELQTGAIADKEKELATAAATHKQAEAEQKSTREAIEKIQVARYASGGGAIEDLKKEIAMAGETLAIRQNNLDKYGHCCRQLALSQPRSLKVFMENRQKMPALKSSEETVLGKLREDRDLAITEGESRRQELKKIEEELASLRLRKSSIPRALIEKRQRLCLDTGIAEEQLPFAGELLEIREGEEEWEGAAERLLHNFALSLLVPEEHYRAVMEWVNKTNLGLRLVYYRIDAKRVQAFAGQSHPLAMAQKLNIKPDTPFGLWLVRELQHRFGHVCCRDMEQFQREAQAITKAGQIKTQGSRHEKDDRHSLNDRRNFVLGFSNIKKIKALEGTAKELQEEVGFYEGEAKLTEEKQQAAQQRLNAIGRLDEYADFSDIDVASLERDIAAKKERKNKLEQENDLLKELDRQLQDLEEKLKAQKEICDQALKRQGKIENKLEDLYKSQEENKKTAAAADAGLQQEIYPWLMERKALALEKETLTLENADGQERKYRQWLSGKAEKTQKEIQGLLAKIVGAMSEYRNKYPEETKELVADIGALPEYEAILGQLTKDDLPKFEQRFKQLLHTNTINQIALFQANLRKEQELIKGRIRQINESLSAIDYNEGRYIRLEYDETYDTDIKSFRIQLKACTEGALTGSNDGEQYAEAKFMQVKAIIERFRGREGETENDQRWTKKVTDVRNWFLFAASERWRETDEEYEHYTDSGGKSGGQKEKLAYTILAASLVYHFGLEGQGRKKSFRFVVIDEAFLKSSDESARFGLELFKRMDLQLLIVTPLLKIPTIAQFISHVGFVHHDDVKHQSMLRNISIEEYQQERREREAGQHARMV